MKISFSYSSATSLTILLASTLLASCTLGPTYHPPTTQLPAHYIDKPHTKTYRSQKIWWQSFGDQTLTHLIQQALDGNNLDIQKAQAQIRQARAALGNAEADYYPAIDAGGKISRDHLSSNSEMLASIPGQIPLYYTDYKAGFDASWELDFWGHTRRATEAANARLQNAIETQQAIALTTAAEIAKIYTQYRTYQQRAAIAQHTIASYAETARLVKLQIQAGSATGVDLQRVESELASAKASLPPLQAEMRASLAALAVMVGQFPQTLYVQLNKPAAIPTLSAKHLAVGLPSDLLQNRPDVRAAERQLAAATADIGVAVTEQFPRFQLVGNLGMDTVLAGTYTQAASHYWSAGPQFSLPLFEGGRLKSAVKQREAIRDSALADYKQSILQALADVESALVRYDQERLKNQNLHASYDKLKTAVKLVKIQYQAGEASLMDVLDVERQLDQLSDQQAQSTGQMTTHLVSLYKALGDGW